MPSGTAASIGRDIEADIAAGRLRPGDRLTPVRTLANELGVSPTTIAAAYRHLRERGFVVGRGRQGTTVAGVSVPTLSQIVSVPVGAIDALRGSPDPTYLPSLSSAFAVATETEGAQYGDALLDEGFAIAARHYFERDGIDATNLTATSGGMDAIEKLLTAFDLRRGDRVGIEDPGHIPVHQIVRAAGFESVPIAMDAYGLTPESLSQALDQNLAALIVTPRAQNPTGAAFTRERADELSTLLAKHPTVAVIQDDHAGPISGADSVRLRPPGERWAVVRSLGKSLGPDLRVSITAGDALSIDRVAIAVCNGPGWVSHLLQRAAAYLLDDPATIAQVESASRSYSERRTHLVEALARHGVESTGRSGLNVWIPVVDEQWAVEAARSAGFAIRAGDVYRHSSKPAVRVTIANLSNDQIEVLAAALGGGATAHHSPAM